MPRKLLLAACLLLLAARAACAQDKGLLRLKFNTGDVYHYAVDISGTGEMSMHAPEIMDEETFDLPIDLSLYSELELNVTGVDKDGAAAIEIFVNRFRMNAGPDMVVDSTDEEQDMPQVIQAMFDEPLTLKMASDGGVLQAEFPDAGEDPDELMGMFFPTDLRPADILKQALFKLPAQAVAPGATWEHKASLPLPLADKKTIEFTYNFTLQGYETVKGLDCAAIAVSVSEDFTKQLSAIELPGFGGEDEVVSMRFDRMLLDFSGTLYFAHKEGVFVGAEGTLEQEMSGAMSSTLEDESVSMNMNLLVDMKIELK
jgi:hypothetical protein